MPSSQSILRRLRVLERHDQAAILAVVRSLTPDEWRQVFSALRANGFPFPELPAGGRMAMSEEERQKVGELMESLADNLKVLYVWDREMARLRAQRRAVAQNASKCPT
jgi:formylmethanofuran dehydrogenase subunit A